MGIRFNNFSCRMYLQQVRLIYFNPFILHKNSSNELKGLQETNEEFSMYYEHYLEKDHGPSLVLSVNVKIGRIKLKDPAENDC